LTSERPDGGEVELVFQVSDFFSTIEESLKTFTEGGD
jgi:hypothetical protein